MYCLRNLERRQRPVDITARRTLIFSRLWAPDDFTGNSASGHYTTHSTLCFQDKLTYSVVKVYGEHSIGIEFNPTFATISVYKKLIQNVTRIMNQHSLSSDSQTSVHIFFRCTKFNKLTFSLLNLHKE